MDYDDLANESLKQFRLNTKSTAGTQLEDDDLKYRAVIQSRDAAFLAASHLSLLNAQIKTIRRLMWAAVILLFMIAGRVS